MSNTLEKEIGQFGQQLNQTIGLTTGPECGCENEEHRDHVNEEQKLHEANLQEEARLHQAHERLEAEFRREEEELHEANVQEEEALHQAHVAEEAKNHCEPRLVKISVDDNPFEIAPGEYTIASIKTLGGVPAGYVLEEIVDGRGMPQDDNGHICIRGGEIFESHPRKGGSA